MESANDHVRLSLEQRLIPLQNIQDAIVGAAREQQPMSAFRHSQIQFVAEIILHQFPAVVIFQLEIGLRKALAASDPSEQGQLIVNGQVALQQRQPRVVWGKIPDANKAAFGIRHMIVRRKGIGGQIDLSTVILLQKTQNPSRVVIMTVGEDQSIHLRQGNPQFAGIVRKASAGARVKEHLVPPRLQIETETMLRIQIPVMSGILNETDHVHGSSLLNIV